MARKYEPMDLYDSVMTEVEITCDVCDKVSTLHSIDDMDACNVFFNDGWRSTKNRTYCPECASKKLKIN